MEMNNKHSPCDPAWPSPILRAGVYIRSKTQQIWRRIYELNQASSVDRLPSFEFHRGILQRLAI